MAKKMSRPASPARELVKQGTGEVIATVSGSYVERMNEVARNAAVAADAIAAIPDSNSCVVEVEPPCNICGNPRGADCTNGRCAPCHREVCAPQVSVEQAARALLVAVNTHFSGEPFLQAEADALQDALDAGAAAPSANHERQFSNYFFGCEADAAPPLKAAPRALPFGQMICHNSLMVGYEPAQSKPLKTVSAPRPRVIDRYTRGELLRIARHRMACYTHVRPSSLRVGGDLSINDIIYYLAAYIEGMPE